MSALFNSSNAQAEEAVEKRQNPVAAARGSVLSSSITDVRNSAMSDSDWVPICFSAASKSRSLERDGDRDDRGRRGRGRAGFRFYRDGDRAQRRDIYWAGQDMERVAGCGCGE